MHTRKSYKILITGANGFIGSHLMRQLNKDGHSVIGIDNSSDHETGTHKQKRARHTNLSGPAGLVYVEDICDVAAMDHHFSMHRPDICVHLAAVAGVGPSILFPDLYYHNNVVGSAIILKMCQKHNVKLMYASSSSIYSGNTKYPFSEKDPVHHQESPYALTKWINEVNASLATEVDTLGLRFFTVYGTFGRPDMAIPIFAKGGKVTVFKGMMRDFTHVDTVTDAISVLIDRGHPLSRFSSKPHHPVVNIGSGKPESVVGIAGQITQGNYTEVSDAPVGVPLMTWCDNSLLKALMYPRLLKDIDIRNFGIPEYMHWYNGFGKYNGW